MDVLGRNYLPGQADDVFIGHNLDAPEKVGPDFLRPFIQEHLVVEAFVDVVLGETVRVEACVEEVAEDGAAEEVDQEDHEDNEDQDQRGEDPDCAESVYGLRSASWL